MVTNANGMARRALARRKKRLWRLWLDRPLKRKWTKEMLEKVEKIKAWLDTVLV